jgi:hypothetical protein
VAFRVDFLYPVILVVMKNLFKKMLHMVFDVDFTEAVDEAFREFSKVSDSGRALSPLISQNGTDKTELICETCANKKLRDLEKHPEESCTLLKHSAIQTC